MIDKIWVNLKFFRKQLYFTTCRAWRADSENNIRFFDPKTASERCDTHAKVEKGRRVSFTAPTSGFEVKEPNTIKIFWALQDGLYTYFRKNFKFTKRIPIFHITDFAATGCHRCKVQSLFKSEHYKLLYLTNITPVFTTIYDVWPTILEIQKFFFHCMQKFTE